MPRSTRMRISSRLPQEQGSWLKARIANAVGTTQLTVSGIHGQPNLSGSKRTRRSTVRNFHFHNQLDSLPTHSSNQPTPRNLAGMALITSRRAIMLVTSPKHHPGRPPKKQASFHSDSARDEGNLERVAPRRNLLIPSRALPGT